MPLYSRMNNNHLENEADLLESTKFARDLYLANVLKIDDGSCAE